MENCHKNLTTAPTLLAPTSANDKQRNLPNQGSYYGQKVRECQTLQQFVLVDLEKAKELHYLLPAVLNQPEEEWDLCINNRNYEVVRATCCLLILLGYSKEILSG